MSDSEFWQCMDDALGLPDGDQKMELLEQAVRLADAMQDRKLGVESRMKLISCATFSGHSEKTIVAFSWVIAAFDESPEVVDVAALLWRYKWIVGNAPNYSAISRQKILELQDDMERRLVENGFSPQVAHVKRVSNARWMWDLDRVKHYYPYWLNSQRDSMSDCLACELSHRMKVLFYLGQPEEAMQVAAPILDGRLSCRTIPQSTYSVLLSEAVWNDDRELATNYHEKNIHHVRGQDLFLSEIADHLIYLAWIGNRDEAIAMLQNHLTMAQKSLTDLHRLEFFQAAGLTLERFPDQEIFLPAGRGLPAELPQGGTVRGGEVSALFLAEVERLAGRFDQRNGNTGQSDYQRGLQERVRATGCR